MGIGAELVSIISTTLKRLSGSPAAQAIVSAKGIGGTDLEAEAYHPHGFFSRAPGNTRGVFIPIGSRSVGVMLGLANYNIGIDIDQGETYIYSTTADGKTIKSRLRLTATGDIELNGSNKRLVTWDELNSAISSLVTSLNSHTHMVASLGAPTGPASASTPPVTFACNIDAAKTTSVKTGG